MSCSSREPCTYSPCSATREVTATRNSRTATKTAPPLAATSESLCKSSEDPAQPKHKHMPLWINTKCLRITELTYSSACHLSHTYQSNKIGHEHSRLFELLFPFIHTNSHSGSTSSFYSPTLCTPGSVTPHLPSSNRAPVLFFPPLTGLDLHSCVGL